MTDSTPILTVLVDGVEIAWDAPPPSAAVARADWLRLTQDAKDIATQLDVDYEMPGKHDPAWRKRAKWALRSKERRAAFLAAWLTEHDGVAVAGETVAGALRLLTMRLADLEGVLGAASRYVDDDSDAAYADLVRSVDAARVQPGASDAMLEAHSG